MGFVWPLPCFLGMGRPDDGFGTRGVFPPETCLALLLLLLLFVALWPGLVRLRPRNASAVLRTWEKSYIYIIYIHMYHVS